MPLIYLNFFSLAVGIQSHLKLTEREQGNIQIDGNFQYVEFIQIYSISVFNTAIVGLFAMWFLRTFISYQMVVSLLPPHLSLSQFRKLNLPFSIQFPFRRHRRRHHHQQQQKHIISIRIEYNLIMNGVKRKYDKKQLMTSFGVCVCATV